MSASVFGDVDVKPALTNRFIDVSAGQNKDPGIRGQMPLYSPPIVPSQLLFCTYARTFAVCLPIHTL